MHPNGTSSAGWDSSQSTGTTGSVGAVGTGVPATYTSGSHLESYSFGGLTGVKPNATAPEFTTLDAEANVGIAFASPVQGISAYYWTSGASSASTITIGLEGTISVSPVDSKFLYYTYSFSNSESISVTAEFNNTVQEGLVWDTGYAPAMSNSLSGSSPVFSNSNRTVSISDLVIPLETTTSPCGRQKPS